jgi:hypothetical protein
MTNKEYLKEMRGLIVSHVIGNSMLKKVWDEAFRHPSFINESVTRIIALGHVKTVGEFLTRFNRWMEKPPTLFSEHQMIQLEHKCGVPQYEFEALPFYCALNPEPQGMTPADGAAANRKHSEAWSRFCCETDQLVKTFGDDAMCEAFDNKEKAYLTPSPELPPVEDGATRRIYPSMKAFLTDAKQNEWDDVVVRAADDKGAVVVDVRLTSVAAGSAA